VHEENRTIERAERLDQAADERLVRFVRGRACAVLQHADAVHDHVDAVLLEEARERSRIQPDDRDLVHRAPAEARLLRRLEAARSRHDAVSASCEVDGHEMADKTGRAEDEDVRACSGAGHHGTRPRRRALRASARG
jgi:glycyl-tRNA synthetase beta subunit